MPPLVLKKNCRQKVSLETSSLVPRPFAKYMRTRKRMRQGGREESGNNYASPQAKAGMLEKVLVCNY